MKPEDILFDLKILTKNRLEGIPMFNFRMRHNNIGLKQWSFIMRTLVRNGKVEVFGPNQMIRPITNEIDRNINQEVRLDESLIKDILSEISPCTPTEAYKFCVQKYGWCNPESFTRMMRKMAELKTINRNDDGKYSINKTEQKPLMAYGEKRWN